MTPQPAGNEFSRRFLEAGDVVKMVVVKLIDKRFNDAEDLPVVDQKSGGFVDCASDLDRHGIGVPMEIVTGMFPGQVDELMRGIK